MRELSKQIRKNGMRLFVPVVEYGLTEFAVSVQQIASRLSVDLQGTLRLSRTTRGGILDSTELQPVLSRMGDQGPTLQEERGAVTASLICT